jgi:hypothetical protein
MGGGEVGGWGTDAGEDELVGRRGVGASVDRRPGGEPPGVAVSVTDAARVAVAGAGTGRRLIAVVNTSVGAWRRQPRVASSRTSWPWSSAGLTWTTASWPRRA